VLEGKRVAGIARSDDSDRSTAPAAPAEEGGDAFVIWPTMCWWPSGRRWICRNFATASTRNPKSVVYQHQSGNGPDLGEMDFRRRRP
jgi:hypothetical protein